MFCYILSRTFLPIPVQANALGHVRFLFSSAWDFEKALWALGPMALRLALWPLARGHVIFLYTSARDFREALWALGPMALRLGHRS